MDATFRHRRRNLHLAIACIPGFLAWAALNLFVFVVMAKPNVDRLAAAAVMGGLPLVMAGLSLWTLIAYWREELTIRDGRIVFRGVVRRKEIGLSELVEARWRPESRRLILRGESTRITVDLRNYEEDDRNRLIDLLRSAIRPEIQTDWALFAHKVGYRRPRVDRTKPRPDEALLTRVRWDRYLVPLLVMSSLAGIASWKVTGEPRFLVTPLILLGAWAFARMVIPRDGVVSTKLSASAPPGSFLRFLLLWTLAALSCLIAHETFRSRMAHPEAVRIVGALIWVGGLLFEAHKEDRRQRRRDREAADQAAKARGERPDITGVTD